MIQSDRPRFMKLLQNTMMAYGKPTPEVELANFWWSELMPFPFGVVEVVFAIYRQQEKTFPPVPNGIIARCQEADGRPDADEAWAIALTSRDDATTVVWTEEMARAMALCKPILDAGDKIGARKSFLASYNNAVLAARVCHTPAVWLASLGDNKEQRQTALADAASRNLIQHNAATMLPPAPRALMLAGPDAETSSQDAGTRARLAKLKSMLAETESGTAKLRRMKVEQQIAQQEKEREDKNISFQKVAVHMALMPLAEFSPEHSSI